MAQKRRSENPPDGQKASSNPVFSGRIECFADGFLGKNMGTVRSNTALQSNRQTWWRGCFVRAESARESLVSVARQTHRLRRGHRLLGANVATPPGASLGGRHGPSTTAYLEENESLHRKTVSAPCVLLAEVFARLES